MQQEPPLRSSTTRTRSRRRGKRGSGSTKTLHQALRSEESRGLIFNLTDKPLEKDATSILNKGLSFVQTPVPDPFQIKVELFKFFRNIKLKYFFHKERTSLPLNVVSSECKPSLKRKSTFCPQITSAYVNTFCKVVERDVETCCLTPSSNVRNNISRGEKEALFEQEPRSNH